MKRQNLVGAMLTLAIAMVLTGCSGSAGRPKAPAPIAVGAIPVVLTPSDIVRPIDSWVPSVAQVQAISAAAGRVTSTCMANYGFAFQAPPIGGLDTAAEAYRQTRSKLYGFFDPVAAAISGYRPAGSTPAARPAGYPTDSEELGVLTGTDSQNHQPFTVFDGKSIPKGGCDAEGIRAVGGSLPAPDDSSLPDGGPTVPVSDPRVVAAFKAWHNCMQNSGFDYQTPTNAFLDPAWLDEPLSAPASARQISTATADVHCKVSLNTVGEVLAVQVAYDNQYVAQHATQLAAYRDQLAKYALEGR